MCIGPHQELLTAPPLLPHGVHEGRQPPQGAPSSLRIAAPDALWSPVTLLQYRNGNIGIRRVKMVFTGKLRACTLEGKCGRGWGRQGRATAGRLELRGPTAPDRPGRSTEPRGRARQDPLEAPPSCHRGGRGCAAGLPATNFQWTTPERCAPWLAKVQTR